MESNNTEKVTETVTLTRDGTEIDPSEVSPNRVQIMKGKFDEVRKKNSRQRTASEDEDDLAKEKGDGERAVRQRCFSLEIQNSTLEKLVDELINITADLEVQVNVLTLTSRKTDALEDKMKAVEISMKEFASKILK